MTHASQPRIGALVSLAGCLLLATPVFAQTGGRGGSVNGGDSISPSGIGSPTSTPIISGPAEPQDESLAPQVANPPGTYGGMGPQPVQTPDQPCKDTPSSSCPHAPPQ